MHTWSAALSSPTSRSSRVSWQPSYEATEYGQRGCARRGAADAGGGAVAGVGWKCSTGRIRSTCSAEINSSATQRSSSSLRPGGLPDAPFDRGHDVLLWDAFVTISVTWPVPLAPRANVPGTRVGSPGELSGRADGLAQSAYQAQTGRMAFRQLVA